MDKQITAVKVSHRGQMRIALQYPSNGQINAIVKRQEAARFSRTMRCWHIPYTSELYARLKSAMPEGWTITEPAPMFPAESIKESEVASKKVFSPIPLTIKSPVKSSPQKIHEKNAAVLNFFVETLQLKGYSSSTIRTYRNEFLQFLQLINSRDVSTITSDELRRYMHYCTSVLGLRENTLHSRLNALKFYFEQVLRREKFFFDIPRPKKQMQLPRVLAEAEMGKLFNALENNKHRAILFTAYSAGLRVSEAVNLKLRDIDSERMQIFIENAKGKKDR